MDYNAFISRARHLASVCSRVIFRMLSLLATLVITIVLCHVLVTAIIPLLKESPALSWVTVGSGSVAAMVLLRYRPDTLPCFRDSENSFEVIN